MSQWRLRELKSDDLKEISSLWNLVMAGAYQRSRLDKDELEALTFSNQTFDQDASFVAQQNGKVVGVVISFADACLENDSFWHMATAGWIGALIVNPSMPKHGLGSELLEKAENVHKNKGRLLLMVGGAEERNRNFIPGLEEQWQQAKRFFENKGYVFVRRTCYVNIDLAKYEFPENIKDRQKQLKAEGFSFGKSTQQEHQAYRQFCLDQKLPDMDKIVNSWQENPAMYIVARSGNRIVGSVVNIYLAKGGKGQYAGITTLPEFRRKGIGKVMLAMAVELLKSQGAESMPLWTRPATHEKFYAKLGFRVDMNYDVYAKKLHQDILSIDWIARYQDPR